MVYIPQAQTLLKLGRYDGSLEEVVRRYSEPLQPFNIGLGNTIKYTLFKKGKQPYFFHDFTTKGQNCSFFRI